MEITNKLILVAMICAASGWMAACQKDAPPTNTVVHNQPTPTNANQPETNKTQTNNNLETNKSISSDASLATPTDAYKTAYAAREKKDLEGLKSVLSKKALEFLTEIGKAENKTLDDQLTELVNRPQAPKAESRGEKINGDKASLEYLDEKGKWRQMDFVKEDGGWKLTIPEAE